MDEYPNSHISLLNASRARYKGRLTFKNPESERAPFINKVANVLVMPNNTLFKNMLNNLGSAQGIKIYNEKENSFIITDDEASIDIDMIPNEMNLLGMEFNFLTKKVGNKTNFKYNISLLNKDKREFVGGEQYQIYLNNRRNLFRAEAGYDKIIKLGDSVTLSAESIGEIATYRWIDEVNDTVIVGQDIQASLLISQKYRLSVEATDGFTDYDSLMVTVKKNYIEKINPNPTTNTTTITYEASQTNNVTIEIMNSKGIITNTYPLSNSQNQYTLNCSGYSSGNYTIILNCDGMRTDAKVLIIE